jgi:hypothetical protein
MAHSTSNLQLYSNLTDNKIGQSVCIRAKVDKETTTYYEYVQLIQFKLDGTNNIATKYVRWRKPKTGYGFWQFKNIINNNTGLVTINFAHIMNGLYDHINSIHRVKIGGSIVNGQLQPAGGSLNITATKNNDGSYAISVSGTGGRQFAFSVTPDSLSPENANEINFATE